MENSFSSVAGSKEEEITTKLLAHIANEAGFQTNFSFVDEVEFSEEGIFKEGENYEYWFKLIPWEDIAIEEGELAMLLTQIMRNQRAIILNPAYTLLFQSKGILKNSMGTLSKSSITFRNKRYSFRR